MGFEVRVTDIIVIVCVWDEHGRRLLQTLVLALMTARHITLDHVRKPNLLFQVTSNDEGYIYRLYVCPFFGWKAEIRPCRPLL